MNGPLIHLLSLYRRPLLTDMASSSKSVPQNSAWEPLSEPLFRSLWIAAVISYTGTWMQIVGAGWLMTQLTMSPLMISLVQAASTVPVFLVILPAGALADLVDRRRFLLITQGWMVVAAATLGLLTLFGHVTPWILLGFTFVLGLGAVMNDPAWQAITPEIVSTRCHAPAVALNSVGFNVARAVGPALGGLVIAAAGSAVAFLLNAASFFGVIFFLYRWKRPHFEQVEKGRMWDALRAGIRYMRGDALVRCILIRTGAFSLAASSLLALLPLLARPYGASGFGLLLGSFGLGALSGAALLPRLRLRFSVSSSMRSASLRMADSGQELRPRPNACSRRAGSCAASLASPAKADAISASAAARASSLITAPGRTAVCSFAALRSSNCKRQRCSLSLESAQISSVSRCSAPVSVAVE